jgi:polyisoprenyl-phosphate glycosyltransferase
MINQNPLISIIIPFFNEEQNVDMFVEEILNTILNLDIKSELILIDDGSIDKTYDQCVGLSKKYSNVHTLSFTRNFGKESAISAGLELSKGDAVITIDGDFQHPINLIKNMVNLWQNEKAMVVEGVKSKRQKESLLYQAMTFLYYKAIGSIGVNDIVNHSDYKLLDRSVVDSWKKLSETNIFYRGIIPWLGYKSVSIQYEVDDRRSGTSKWGFISLVKYAISSITSFTAAPLYSIVLLGLIFLLFSVFFGFHTFYVYFFDSSVDGFATIILLLLIIGSFIMISLGVLGLYILNLFTEIKKRPRYVIQHSTFD